MTARSRCTQYTRRKETLEQKQVRVTHREARQPARSAASAQPSKADARWRSVSRLKGRMWVLAAGLLVLAGFIAAVVGARAVSRSDSEEARLASHLTSADIASTLNLAILHEEDLVDSASAFVTGNPRASPADFDRWAGAVRAMSRYPELQNIGLVSLIPASRLAAFERYIVANPVRAMGPDTVGPAQPFAPLPPGRRPYYCFAVAGLARDAASYLPAGVDYCAIAPTLINGRDSGMASYAPFASARATTLGIETPVYRGGLVPATVSARRRAFMGWVGELLVPQVILATALQGHRGFAVVFTYRSQSSHAAFRSGAPRPHAERTTIDLHNGWTVQSFGPAIASGMLADTNALILLVGGALLSLVFGMLVSVLATGRRRALSLVREKTRELSHQALHDSLTGLPNRALVLDRAQNLLARGKRQHGAIAGALFIDVDGFKQVNDTFGHAAGDQLLKIVATRLRGALRPEDTIGRLGGDEFVVLVESTGDTAALEFLAERLNNVLREPIELQDGQMIPVVTVSIGAAFGNYTTVEALLQDADRALYAAKSAGKDRHVLFDQDMYAGV
jgi:diguanylate cyclase (GGDEF)-like protein